MSHLNDEIRERVARIERESTKSKPGWHIAASAALWQRLKRALSAISVLRAAAKRECEEVSPSELPVEVRNELAFMLSRIDQEIERAKTTIDSAGNELRGLQAQVTLAELENLRYEVEGKLGGSAPQ